MFLKKLPSFDVHSIRFYVLCAPGLRGALCLVFICLLKTANKLKYFFQSACLTVKLAVKLSLLCSTELLIVDLYFGGDIFLRDKRVTSCFRAATFFYNLDQIVCVGACVGEVKKQARSHLEIFFRFQASNRFLVFSKNKQPVKNKVI